MTNSDGLSEVNTQPELFAKKRNQQAENQLTQGAAFLPTEEIFRHVALAEHSLSFVVRWMFDGSFNGVRPCDGRDSATRRKDERRDNLHPQEQETFKKEVLHGIF